MQRRITTDTVVTGLEDRIEDLKELLDNNTTMLESYTRTEYSEVDRLFDVCYTFVEYYHRLKERE